VPGGKKGNADCVTHAECSQTMEPLLKEIYAIKNALVGPDLRGGLVNQVTGIQNKLDDVIKEREEQKKTNLKYKILTVSLAFTLIGIFVEAIVNHYLH
jgi:hypothetical protein